MRARTAMDPGVARSASPRAARCRAVGPVHESPLTRHDTTRACPKPPIFAELRPALITTIEHAGQRISMRARNALISRMTGRLVSGVPGKSASCQPNSPNRLPVPLYLAQNGSPNQVAGHRDTASWAGFDGEVFTKAGLRADLDRTNRLITCHSNKARPGQRAGGGPTYLSRDNSTGCQATFSIRLWTHNVRSCRSKPACYCSQPGEAGGPRDSGSVALGGCRAGPGRGHRCGAFGSRRSAVRFSRA